jgi:predicted O-methyltransferase YrrM
MTGHETEYANGIPTRSTLAERSALAVFAERVPAGGLIVEIGGLYGGTTGILALANPKARIIVIDNFSWQPPENEKIPTAAALVKEMTRIGVTNVDVIDGDSASIGAHWKESIDLLFIDGQHSYDVVKADLRNFAPHACIMACHDYAKGYMKGVRLAVDRYRRRNPSWRVVTVVDSLVILRKVTHGGS